MRRPATFAALALAALAVCLALGVPRAGATDPFPVGGHDTTLSNANFTVHYNASDTDATCLNFITQQQAGDILGMLDRARSYFTTLGFPALAPGVNVSVDDFTNACIEHGAIPLGTPDPLDRWDALVEPLGGGVDNIHLDAHDGVTYPIIAHEVFHLVEDALAPGTDQWLKEATAEWAATRANNAAGAIEVNPDRTLDCVGSECGDSEFDKNGYPGWMLIEYLAERYGDAKVKALWDQAAANPSASGTTDLAAVLDTTLAKFYNDFANKRLNGDFTFPVLAASIPATSGGFTVGKTDHTSDVLHVTVNHLAARYIYLKHETEDAQCFEATLTVNVTIPAGVESYPAYYAGVVGATVQPLTISGSNASITVPWNTCAGSPDAYVSLPNDSLALDGREFAVQVTVAVDTTKPAAPTSPPPGAHVIGTPTDAPTSDPAPTLTLYAPEVLRVSTKTRLLRFVVFSSGDGKLQASLGSTSLGTATLRGGNNDVRFVLPTQLFKSLQTKKKAASNVLQLTSMSPAGAQGASFTRKVLVQKPPPPKKKKKAKKH
jgi:hypothetical protein